MLHAFVDTNIYLSLYAFTDDNIGELQKLIALLKSKKLKLHVPTIVNQEFYRNRDKKLAESLGGLERFAVSAPIPRFMEHHDEVSEIRAALKIVKEKRTALMEKARAEILDKKLAADELFRTLRDVAGLLAISDDVDKAARRRLERSNPPGKDGSLGDRLNWETLLKAVPKGNDVHVVSRDKDFASPLGTNVPNSFLDEEWEVMKEGKMYLYPDLRSFLAQHFPEIKLPSDVAKAFAIKSLAESGSWPATHAAIAQLMPLVADLNAEDSKQLFAALRTNPEIHAIATDEDVKSFYQQLLADHWNVLNKDEYEGVTMWVEDPVPF